MKVEDEVPEVAIHDGECEVHSWKNVLECKPQDFDKNIADCIDGSGGRDAGSWEILDCSHASECGSTVRSIPGSEFGLSDSTGDGSHVNLTQEFEETHARALAEIEACEAADEALVREGIAASVSTLLPISTEVLDSNSCEAQLHSGASDVDSIVAVSPDGFSSPDTTIAAFGSEGGLDSFAMLDKDRVDNVEKVEVDGFSTSEELIDLGSSNTKSEPDGHEVLVELQELPQEDSVDGSKWLEFGRGKVEEQNLVDEGDRLVEDMSGDRPVASPRAVGGNLQHLLGVEADLPTEKIKDSTCVEDETTDMTNLEGCFHADKGIQGCFSLSRFAAWVQHGIVHAFQCCGNLVWSMFPETPVLRYYNQVQFAMNRVDWTGVARNASIALLSALVFGLAIENQRMSQEVKKKQEEISKLMMALMNFQELWSSHRATRVPILRHTGFAQLANNPY